MIKPHPEITPPWVAWPDFPPGDFFWRNGADAWYGDVWYPFWQQLQEQEKKEYLERFKAPEEWRWYLMEFMPWLEIEEIS